MKKKEIEIRMEDKKTEKIKDDDLNLSFVKIRRNLNLGQLKKYTFRAFASRANKMIYKSVEVVENMKIFNATS